MKTLLLAFTVFALAGCAGLQPAKQTSIENVADVPGQSKDQIYTASKIWLAETFRSAKEVIEVDDKAAGVIIGNGQIIYPCSGMSCVLTQTIKFTLRIDIKDAKYKTTFSNLMIATPPSQYYPNGTEGPLYQDAFDNSQPALVELSNKLRASIEKEPVKANW